MGKIKAYLYRRNNNRCNSCGKKLEEYELKYYGLSCEKCETRIEKRLKKA